MPETEAVSDRIATLQVTSASASLSAVDLQLISGSLGGLVAGAVWGVLTTEEFADHDWARARDLVSRQIQRRKAGRRFFPDWAPRSTPEDKDILRQDNEFDPLDPLDAGVRDGLNTFLARSVLQSDRDLYAKLFGFANIVRIEHRSPIVIELTVAVGLGVGLPALLVVGLMGAVVYVRKSQADAAVRETEAEMRKEELKQKRLQTVALERVVSVIKEMDPSKIPPGAIEEAVKVSTVPIADLGSSPLIGDVTFGFSKKAG